MKTFEERMIKKMDRRDRMEKRAREPRTLVTLSVVWLIIGVGVMILMTLFMMKSLPEVRALLDNKYGLGFLGCFYLFACALTASADNILGYFYQKKVKKFWRLRRTAELQNGNSDILRTSVPVSYGKLEQK